VTDIPIIMSAPMVLATLREIEAPGAGKRMTRRLSWSTKPPKSYRLAENETYRRATAWQNVKPGDRLWVRERMSRVAEAWQYEADKVAVALDRDHPAVSTMIAWAHHYERDYCPSIHMPRWASRLTLEVTAVKVERLQEISEDDARAEGIRQLRDGSGTWAGREGPGSLVTPWLSAREAFSDLWDSLHGAGAWVANPEVVALTFLPHLCNVDRMPQQEAA